MSERKLDIAANLQAMRARIKSGVTLIAVSKTMPSTDVAAAVEAGQRDFGENYVQEALQKIQALQQLLPDITPAWHFIGPLQSNKCREVAMHFDWLHSLDRSKLIEPLARFRPANKPPLKVLIQVNIDDEQSKSGCAPNAVFALAQQIVSHPSLALRGLMVIPNPNGDRRASFSASMTCFAQLQNDLRAKFPAHVAACDQLSMGMSDDFELACDLGSTMVRVGSKIFGARGVQAADAVTQNAPN